MYDEAPSSWFGRSTTAGSPDLCGLLLSTATCLMAKDLLKKEPLKFLTKIVVVALHCDSMSQFLLRRTYLVQSYKIIESCNISTSKFPMLSGYHWIFVSQLWTQEAAPASFTINGVEMVATAAPASSLGWSIQTSPKWPELRFILLYNNCL